MKDYKDITYKYLKTYKKRTILTIFGIILSIALMTAIGTMIVSVRDAKLKNAIRVDGKYHGIIKAVDKEKVDTVINNVKVKEAGIGREEGSGVVSKLTEEEKRRFDLKSPYRYININSYDEKALSLLPYKLKEGRFPSSPNEIAIEYWIVDDFPKKVKIGDKIKVPIGTRYIINEDENGKETKTKAGIHDYGSSRETFEQTDEKEFTIVGLLDTNDIWKGKNSTEAITYIDKDSLVNGHKYDIYLKMNSLKDIHNEMYKMAGVNNWKQCKVDDDLDSLGKVKFNESILKLYGKSLNKSYNWYIVGLFIFVVSLIMIATIAVIYNSFNISVLERTSQFGLLRTIGATPEQIKRIVMEEAALLGLIGIPAGLAFGVIATKLVLYVVGFFKFNIIVDFTDLKMTYSIPVYIIATVLGLITIFLSANKPSKKAGEISPLEAIRSTGDYKKEDLRRVKSFRFIRKIFGVEGEIAYKNLKRDRKRFNITVFSMVISVALFITFSTFSNYMVKVRTNERDEDVDFEVNEYFYSEESSNIDTMYNDLRNMKDVNKVYRFRDGMQGVFVKEEIINPKLKEAESMLYDPGESKGDYVKIYTNYIYTFGDENIEYLQPLLKEGKINLKAMNEENGVLLITRTTAYNMGTGKKTTLDGYDINVGDELIINVCDNEGKGEKNKVVKVMGILERGPLYVGYGNNGGMNIITTDEVFDKLILEKASPLLYVAMEKDGNRERVLEYLEKLRKTNSHIDYTDYSEVARDEKNTSIVINIFLYGFVVVIGLISSINIVNTISTNLILRSKELAMLKAVGMDQEALKKMVSLESLYYGLYATIYGGIVGTGLTYILYRIILEVDEFEWAIPWKNILIGCGAATLIALLSGYIPLRRMDSKDIIERVKIGK